MRTGLDDDEAAAFERIGKPAERALASAGHKTLHDLTKVTEEELLSLHGMGPKAIGILRERMKAQGLAFAQK